MIRFNLSIIVIVELSIRSKNIHISLYITYQLDTRPKNIHIASNNMTEKKTNV